MDGIEMTCEFLLLLPHSHIRLCTHKSLHVHTHIYKHTHGHRHTHTTCTFPPTLGRELNTEGVSTE